MLAALLLATAWVVVPVSTSPTPSTQTPLAAPAPPSVPVAPQIEALDREVDRLRDRLVEPVSAPVISRDPFQFAAARDVPRLVVSEMPVAESQPLAIAWPSLVAILRSGSDAAPTMRAVFEDRSQVVQFRSTGEALGDIVVTTITTESVTLTHTPSGQATTVTLR